MKLIHKTLIAVLFIFIVTSCDEKIDEINRNPDTFPQPTDAQMLSAAQGYLGYIVDVDLNLSSFLWAQYYTWGIGVSIGNQERYVSEPDDFDAYWGRAYANVLTDLKYLREKSDSYGYRGVAKVLEAYTYQGLVDHFGNVPFTQAVSGLEGIVKPEYDDAEDVYAALVTKIDDALNDFDLAGAQTPSQIEEDDEDHLMKFVGMRDNDFMYGGEVEKWIRFANSLKLRILMRTSEVAPQQTAVEALITSGIFIETEADMPVVSFSDISGSQNPMWAVMTAGVGDFYFASNATLSVLNNLSDPRENAFYRNASTGPFTGSLHGIDQGTIDDEPFTNPNTHYSQSTAMAVGPGNDVIFMSSWEVWFLRAEAAARYGTTDNEVTAFETAVQANFDFLGVAGGPAYITSLDYDMGDALNTKLDNIAVQKWISMNGTQEDEGWIETRRFDRPASELFTQGIFQTPPLSVLGAGNFPSSWLIPASERSLNSSNAPAQRLLTHKIFWDN